MLSCFSSDRIAYDLGIRSTLVYRREGSTWEPRQDDLIEDHSSGTGADVEVSAVSFGTRASLLPILEGVLTSVLAKFQSRMTSLPADRQYWVAERVVQAKERLADRIMTEVEKNGANVITEDLIKMCMEEVGRELRSYK